ncbi:putative digeranylgeranylglycerophospholipid reductase [Candidatus Nitrososphaera gargensis Ga9.2]|uniref:Putative digeranylgeranylglycerophospholipid reductase n=1 Tax=Nitrososphaera gargensis (strain Ga9.2) TaxID=1237085 RepID=K0I9T7_NITGG|nr:NAD(P)/FAD-dependent oxidoreductase [Candidatus Nitrososphaera gargensis]AFU58091.1 putative digeranylgeranylglycerophospholipid reductase [Candidatus Nitrososphaera gargensis Ga9.2]
MEEERYDIAVVGGGPAGLSAAYSAARAGAKVVLFEKDEAIAHSVRTSGVTWISEMERLGIPARYYNPVQNYRFVSPLNDVMISGSTPKSCVLDVRGTYQHLAFMAAEAGAKIMVKSNIINVLKQDNNKIAGVKASTPKGDLTVRSTLVIDASGFSASVARRAGASGEWKRYGVGAEYECYCDDIDSATWVLMVGRRYSDAGYAWIFPLSRNRVRIGVGIGRPESSAEPLEKLHDILEKRHRPLDTFGKIQPVELHYGFIPNEGVRQNSIADGLVMVGDSAGQSNPLVLEGIRYAIEFGRLAGEVGAKSLPRGASRESLMDYEKAWKAKVESKIQSALRVQTRWLGLTDEEWDKEIEILRDMTVDEFLDFIKADFTAGKMMKLALHHPKLAARQLFNMILKS